MKFPWQKQAYQPIFHFLNIDCYWYSAVVCLFPKSHMEILLKSCFYREEEISFKQIVVLSISMKLDLGASPNVSYQFWACTMAVPFAKWKWSFPLTDEIPDLILCTLFVINMSGKLIWTLLYKWWYSRNGSTLAASCSRFVTRQFWTTWLF